MFLNLHLDYSTKFIPYQRFCWICWVDPMCYILFRCFIWLDNGVGNRTIALMYPVSSVFMLSMFLFKLKGVDRHISKYLTDLHLLHQHLQLKFNYDFVMKFKNFQINFSIRIFRKNSYFI